MTSENERERDELPTPTPTRRFEDLPPAAQRALREAEVRRAAASGAPAAPPEINGRKGPEPVRFGDWEKNGLISDF